MKKQEHLKKKEQYMLQVKNLKKEYITGDLKQIALDDVSINFRENEFVAILGPSGRTI